MSKFKISNFKFQIGNKGFTLVELLVVIAIVGVLAVGVVAMINPNFQQIKARDLRRKTDLAKLQSALELYRSDQGSYPLSPLPSCGSALIAASTTYVKAIPCDPKNTGQYVYTYVPSGTPPTAYFIYACLENASDTQKDSVNNATYCTGGASNWSYTVTNP